MGAGTAGAVVAGAAGTGAGVAAGRMTMTTTRMDAIRTTALITMTRPIGTAGFLTTTGAGAGAGAAGAATTGAGALLIIRVKSLGPEAAGPPAGCAPPSGDNGVLLPAAKMGGGRMPGLPPSGLPAEARGEGAEPIGAAAGADGNTGALIGAGGTKGEAGAPAPAGGLPIGDGTPPNNGACAGIGGGAAGVAVAATGGQAGGAAGGATGEAGVLWGSGAAVAGAENIRVNSPGPVDADGGDAGAGGGKILCCWLDDGAKF